MKKNKLIIFVTILILMVAALVVKNNLGSSMAAENFPINDYEREIIGDTIYLKRYNGSSTEINLPQKITYQGSQYFVGIDSQNPGLFSKVNTTDECAISGTINNKAGVKKVTFADGIKAKSLFKLFWYNDDLEEVKGFNKLDLDDDGVSMFGAFRNCKSLKALDLSGMQNTQYISSMEQMFDGAGIEYLDFSSFDMSGLDVTEDNKGSMLGTFNTSSIKEITIGPKNDFKVSSGIGGSFGRGLWKKVEDRQYYSIVDVLIDTSNKNKNVVGTYKRYDADYDVSNSDNAVKYEKYNTIDQMLPRYNVDYKIKLSDITVKSINRSKSTPSNSIINTSNGIGLVNLYNHRNDNNGTYKPGGETVLFLNNVVTDASGEKLYNLRMTFSDITVSGLNNVSESKWSAKDKNQGCISRTDENYIFNLFLVRDGGFSFLATDPGVTFAADIKVEIFDGNTPVTNGSFVFSAYDLDRGEGIKLISGYDDESITYYKNEALTVYNKSNTMTKFDKTNDGWYLGTINDNGSELSEIHLKANASGFNFSWTATNLNSSLFSYYQPGLVDIVKKDDTGKNLAGAKLKLYRKVDNKLIGDEWTSSTNEAKRFLLTTGSYVIKETEAPTGYTKSNDIEFYVDITGKLYLNNEQVTEVVVRNNRRNYPYTVNYLEKGTNKVLNDPRTEQNKKYGDVITSANEVIKIENYTYDSVDKDSITIKEEDNVINIYYVKNPGKIVVIHKDEVTGEEIAPRVPMTGKIDEEYTTSPVNVDRYFLTQTPGNAKGKYKAEDQEVIYLYRRIYKVITRVEGIGGTISGDENVLEANDSTKDYIKIKADEKHFIEKITINGQEIPVTNPDNMTLDNFLNMHEDKEVVVSFGTKTDVPKTDFNTFIPYIAGFVLIIGLVITYIGIKKKKRINLNELG